ncbi:hypothetical protein [Shewanella algidipiscicola]|uniref:Uncharacterized protein n=1 Tax=Shewanella algidipiscicola TaxID=614070 RepID=A0ABQ4PCR7_9GAMM|nr:hypothetical protein [Shewanella algidipiscicola]GIU45348.1 hypothetical protein TUM4630_13210 [Shewanella algidipiscicola]
MRNEDVELENTVKRVYLDTAIEALESNGRYWNSTIPRPTAKKLYQMLEERGYGHLMHTEISPRYEHVFYHERDFEQVQLIAIERARLQNLYPEMSEQEFPI